MITFTYSSSSSSSSLRSNQQSSPSRYLSLATSSERSTLSEPRSQHSSAGSLSQAISSERSSSSDSQTQSSALSSQSSAKDSSNGGDGLSFQALRTSPSTQSTHSNQTQKSTSPPSSTPSTGPAQEPAQALEPMPKRNSPGSWKHPRAQEIAQRQRDSTFGPDNVATVIKWILILSAVEVLRWNLDDFTWKLISPIYQLTDNYPLWIMRILVLCFAVIAVKPLWSGPDQLLDIDLNATQRSLLGLDPNATPPATPATKYVTPPRYARSITPQSGTPGSRGSSPASSPLAYKNGFGYRGASGSFSTTDSPSQRASISSNSRRHSFGLGTPSKDGSVFAPQTPSPPVKASGIVFSNKWLYHKGIRSGSKRRDLF